MAGTGLEIDVALLPPPRDVDTGLRAAVKDMVSVRKSLDKFLDAGESVPDLQSLALQIEWAGANTEKCRLALQQEELACRVSMVARFRKAWPIIIDSIRYIVRGK